MSEVMYDSQVRILRVLPSVLCKSGSDTAQAAFVEPLLQVRAALGLCLPRTELATRSKKVKFKKCLGSISREQSILRVLYLQPGLR